MPLGVATTRTPQVGSAGPSSRTPEGAPVESAAQVTELEAALQTARRCRRGRTLRLPAPHGSHRAAVVDAMVEVAVGIGAAVSVVDAPAGRGAADNLFGFLCTGRAPVLSPSSAYALGVLNGRRLAQLQLLEGLLRRHACHRPILILVAGSAALDEDSAWILHHLPSLLRDSAVTWVYVEPGSETRPGAGDRADRPRFGWGSLTGTELKVARLIAEGHSNRSAAAELSVSVNTISTHLRSVFAKVGVNSRVQLTRVVLQQRRDP